MNDKLIKELVLYLENAYSSRGIKTPSEKVLENTAHALVDHVLSGEMSYSTFINLLDLYKVDK